MFVVLPFWYCFHNHWARKWNSLNYVSFNPNRINTAKLLTNVPQGILLGNFCDLQSKVFGHVSSPSYLLKVNVIHTAITIVQRWYIKMPTLDDSETIMQMVIVKDSRKCFSLQGMWLLWNSETKVSTECLM